jgi:hypothetical protein
MSVEEICLEGGKVTGTTSIDSAYMAQLFGTGGHNKSSFKLHSL